MLRHCIPVVGLLAVVLSGGVAAESKGYARSSAEDMGNDVVDAQIAEQKRSGADVVLAGGVLRASVIRHRSNSSTSGLRADGSGGAHIPECWEGAGVGEVSDCS